MSRTIWKYALQVEDFQVIEMPRGAQLLTVQVQNGEPCIWALVDPSAELECRSIYIKGTGHPCAEIVSKYLGTFQLRGGLLVFHVFWN